MNPKGESTGNIAEPRQYGEALGLQTAMEGGSALANSAFFNHGSREKQSDPIAGPAIFDTVFEMEAAGFVHRYDDTFNIVGPELPADEQILYGFLHAEMVPFAYLMISSTAQSVMQPENSAKFGAGLANAVSNAMTDCGLYLHHEEAAEALKSLTRQYESASCPVVVSANPACGDFLEYSLTKCVDLPGAQSQFAFARTGTCRFKDVTDPFFAETFKSIFEATKDFGW